MEALARAAANISAAVWVVPNVRAELVLVLVLVLVNAIDFGRFNVGRLILAVVVVVDLAIGLASDFPDCFGGGLSTVKSIISLRQFLLLPVLPLPPRRDDVLFVVEEARVR